MSLGNYLKYLSVQNFGIRTICSLSNNAFEKEKPIFYLFLFLLFSPPWPKAYLAVLCFSLTNRNIETFKYKWLPSIHTNTQLQCIFFKEAVSNLIPFLTVTFKEEI